MADQQPLLQILGLAARAGRLVAGTGRVRAAVRRAESGPRVAFVLLADDASLTQRAKVEPLLKARRIPFGIALPRAQLGAALGRAPVSAVAITDANFARRVRELVGSTAQGSR